MATEEQRSEWLLTKGTGIKHELVVCLDVLATSSLSPATIERFTGLISRFATRLVATGTASLATATDEDCEAFCWARTRRNTLPSIHTVHLRRSAIRSLFNVLEQLGEAAGDPSSDIKLPSKRVRRARPLTDDEMTLVRTAALGRRSGAVRATMALALAEAGATTGEIPNVTWGDLDLKAGTARLPGAAPIKSRCAALSPWGLPILRGQLTALRPDSKAWIVTRVAPYADAHSGQAAISNLLSKLLRAAGLFGDDVRPGSIRLWAGSVALQSSGIEAAARTLGLVSLDATADALRAKGTSESGARA